MEERKFTLKPCLISTLFSVVVLILLTLLLSVIAKMTPLSENFIRIGSYVALAIVGLSGGITAGKGIGKMGVICGTIVGITLIITIKLFELISVGSVTFDNGFYISSLCTFCSAVLGGIIGVN